MRGCNLKYAYQSTPDSDVEILCGYTTRFEGFCDILISSTIRSSRELFYKFPAPKMHRALMGDNSYFATNSGISFSVGHTSYRYSDKDICSLDDYVGGFGLFVPIDSILREESLEFSHCSKAGGINNYDLNRENIRDSFHKARKNDELVGDGYGNLFEVIIDAVREGNRDNPERDAYPEVDLQRPEIIVAAPASLKSRIQHQERHLAELRDFLIDIESQKNDGESFYVGAADFRGCVEEAYQYLTKLLELEPYNLNQVFWYNHKNLDEALKDKSLNF